MARRRGFFMFDLALAITLLLVLASAFVHVVWLYNRDCARLAAIPAMARKNVGGNAGGFRSKKIRPATNSMPCLGPTIGFNRLCAGIGGGLLRSQISPQGGIHSRCEYSSGGAVHGNAGSDGVFGAVCSLR